MEQLKVEDFEHYFKNWEEPWGTCGKYFEEDSNLKTYFLFKILKKPVFLSHFLQDDIGEVVRSDCSDCF